MDLKLFWREEGLDSTNQQGASLFGGVNIGE